MPLPHRLTYRKANEEPEGYRISYDGVEVGSVSQQIQHIKGRWQWRWGVDTMPLMDRGGRPPSGDVWLGGFFEAALGAFKAAFTKWHSELPPGLWEKNVTYIQSAAERRRNRP